MLNDFKAEVLKTISKNETCGSFAGIKFTIEKNLAGQIVITIHEQIILLCEMED